MNLHPRAPSHEVRVDTGLAVTLDLEPLTHFLKRSAFGRDLKRSFND